MKTAISLPDAIFERASRRASDLGMSRSEFFARAATNYLDELDSHSVTAQINAALAQIDEVDDSTSAAVAAGHRILRLDATEW
ncbi:CopG family transcriptional regulator [Cryobacterium sp. CG_9.6]|uniref:CopG family transcriptional regulator n=1 Tax=Cryobacterium sp. CG_9.6 TaxID=2760710 RepID=UPI002475B9FC|nr:CopG family transcriptional regulator [Cryobacterium sp. CG_9.6]MDH6236159.1 metal-responsive CopG/Arc/MetJ family transcriptional regulator [Cryobacterium sp. CG_9.6]